MAIRELYVPADRGDMSKPVYWTLTLDFRTQCGVRSSSLFYSMIVKNMLLDYGEYDFPDVTDRVIVGSQTSVYPNKISKFDKWCQGGILDVDMSYTEKSVTYPSYKSDKNRVYIDNCCNIPEPWRNMTIAQLPDLSESVRTQVFTITDKSIAGKIFPCTMGVSLRLRLDPDPDSVTDQYPDLVLAVSDIHVSLKNPGSFY